MSPRRLFVSSSLRGRVFASLLASITLGGCEPAPARVNAPAPAEASAAVASASSSATRASASAAPSVVYTAPAPPSPPVKIHLGGAEAVRGSAGLVTSVETHATQAGAEILRKGGNAIDAAIATAFVLAVTHPSAGNLGGGGFMIVRTKDGGVTAIDFRETAPASATVEKNHAQLDAGAVGWLSAAVPGTVAGLALAHEKFGSKPWAELLAPAIALARKGHRLGARQATVLGWNWEKLKKDPTARAIYGRGKAPLHEGDVWKQPDLAATLEAIAKGGAKGFYEGAVAEKIEKAMHAHGGMVTAADLGKYQAKIRTPLHFAYRGFEVDTMPPPSMGGVAFAQTMLELDRWKAWQTPAGSGASLHAFVEAARRSYTERRIAGGDPDFQPAGAIDAKIAELLSPAHLATRKPAFDPAKATPSSAFGASDVGAAHESPQTTHLSTVDADGNAVSLTTTLSAAFGSKVVAGGTGVLFSNAMGAFSESGVNTLAPGKRMASSMTPAIVTQEGKLVVVLGSPGGDTIPNTVSQVFRNLVDYDMTIDQAVAAPRLHHQYLPDKVRVEKTNPPSRAALDDLGRRGDTIDLEATPIGDANDLVFDPATGAAFGVADKREGGKAEGVEKRAGDVSASR